MQRLKLLNAAVPSLSPGVGHLAACPPPLFLPSFPVQQLSKKGHYVYVYAFSRHFYPKRLTNEDITLQLTSKLTISYIEGNHQSDSVRGDRGECRDRVQA